MNQIEHVEGKDKGKIMLYALSTCGWCRKTKHLLEDLNVGYDFVYVDQLEGSDKDDTMKEVRKWNPRSSFPTLVINNKIVITGFKDDEIRKALM
jgi:glutaredoxin